MAMIVLTESQVRTLTSSDESVSICGPNGKEIGTLAAPRPRGFLMKPDPGPHYTSEQMRARLDALEAEIARRGREMTKEELRVFMAKLRADDPPRTILEGFEPCTG